MNDTAENQIIEKLEKQRAYFSSNATRSVSFRREQLRQLKKAILQYREKIEAALWADLHKSAEEAYLTEISIVSGEIDYHLKKLKQWARPKKVKSPLHLWPSKSKIHYEALGVALIVAPWNYPFQLLLNPLVGAISAGCCSMLKPSPDAPATAKIIEEMLAAYFPAEYITVVQGRRETNTRLLSRRFDIIFFTGSPQLGKIVMEAASKYLTPVVLELGGKSPCIVDAGANINLAAKRIVWGKLINAGQTCIAPDFLLVHHSLKNELLDKMAQNIRLMYGENIKESRYYPRIVSERAMDRLTELLKQGHIHTGGEVDRQQRYIAPTIIDEVQPDFLLMQDEIFGPILPVMTYKHLDEALAYINANEKPLAFYYFGKNKKAKEVLSKSTSGGGCINDTLMHIANHHLPFGGVGNSGTGKYHGHESFLAFSNQRSIVTTPTAFDLPLKYVPFKYFKLLEKILK
ncbi:aldehyde dehydrogenase [Roseimarinus sediminis]|uniref:aldehyde dehydrogenase n=1 Tax=Roseimarinus sediminis TaxID=1610899 RepID=UPI003D23709A